MNLFDKILCLLMLAPNFIIVSCGGGSSKADTPLVWNQKPVRLSGRALSSKVQWESLADARKRRRAKASVGVTSIATSQKACGFCLWDFVSAGMYHTCQYLMKNRIYEGRGGRKFVRIEPGSLLQLLHPCSRHSPDKCVFCGGTFNEHLTLWWSKHLYSPYDLYMDRTYENGVLQRVVPDNGRSSSRRREAEDVEPKEKYAFHAQYVMDLGMLLQGITKTRDRTKKLQQIIAESSHLSDPVEMHVVEQLKTVYVVPSLDDLPKQGIRVSFLKYVRNVLLDELDALMVIQAKENSDLKRREAAKSLR